MNNFQYLPAVNVDFLVIYVFHVFDQVNLCQAVFACFGASHLERVLGNFVVLYVP